MLDSNQGLEHIEGLPEWARPYTARFPRKSGVRLFVLTWDNSRNLDPRVRNKQEKQTCEGCRFANGVIALDSGRGFETLSEMEATLGLAGHFTISWEDDNA